MKNRTLCSLLLVLFAGLALSGCEEESDDSSDNTSPPVMDDPPAQTAINTNNAGTLATNTFQGLNTAGSNAGAMNLGLSVIGCDNAGTLTPTGTGLDDLMLMVGESFGADFGNCETGGLTLDGSVTYTATAITGVFLDLFADWSVTFDVTFTGFTATDGSQVESLDETFTMNFSYNATTSELTVDQDGETLVLQGGSLVFNDLSYAEMNGNYELSFDATFDADGLTNDLALTTPQPLVGPILGVPESGQVLITANDGSTLTLTFTGGGAVTVALDEDGDTVIDCSQDLTFDTLDQFDPGVC